MALMIVATMKVKRTELETFRRFERLAARIMGRHGGTIERAVFVDSGEGDWVREVHLVRFKDVEAFERYREDQELKRHAALRARCVLETEVLVGEDVDYSSASNPTE
ncbi:MAG: DUF1330 domain-containing protein [Myxococcales bacterium]|nr:DUF1330 domain-containing protein [Myxococcales bacterium]